MLKGAVTVVFIFFISTLAPVLCFAGAPLTKELVKGVYAYIGGEGSTNSGFIITGKGVVVIDSQGLRGRALDLKASIGQKTKKPVIYIINTHYHGDHTFGNQFFKGVVISQKTVRDDLIEKDKAQRKRFKKFFGPTSLEGFRLTLPQITFAKELRLHEGEKTIIIRHTGPAHTRGDAYVFLPGERIVFTGDILYKGRLPWLGDGSVRGNIRALDELIGLDANIYVPGHGGVAAKRDLLIYKGYLTDLTKEVKRLKTMGLSVKEVGKEIKLPAYSAYLKYKEWLPLNAAAVYRELEKMEKTRAE